MNTLVTNNTIEPPKTTEGREYGLEASRNATQPSSDGSRLRNSQPTTLADNGVTNDETACANTDECTYETQETHELQEPQETDESHETKGKRQLSQREEIGRLGLKLLFTIDEPISECRVFDGNVNRPLFMLAHKVRTIEEELNRRFSINVCSQILDRWKEQNRDQLERGHDYLVEFLDKLSLVRYPKGRALANAVELARDIAPPAATQLLSRDVQLLASLCKVLQQQAAEKPFFLDGRSAAKALAKPHETVASWLRALCRLPSLNA
jgi:hypothetical protein